MRSMMDAAVTPSTNPHGCSVVGGYLGSPAAYRSWSLSDWRQVEALPGVRWLLPIWVATGGDGAADARTACADAAAIGCPIGVAIALDVEQNVAQRYHDSGYVDRWCETMQANGGIPLVYTSASSGSLFRRWPLWLAEWDNRPELIGGTLATQYASPVSDPSLTVDLSVVSDVLALWPIQSHNGGQPVPPTLNAPIVAVVQNPAGAGYWLIGADGGVFAFGVPFFGSHAGKPLAAPIVDAFASHSGRGYALVGADGGVFTFGDVPYKGSIPDETVHKS